MKNQNDLDKFLDKLIKKAENRIDQIYAKRLKNIQTEITAMYEKYEVDGVLTMAEMTKFNRLQKSMDIIIGELSATYREAYSLTQTTMQEQYLESYFRTAYLAEFEAQKKMGFGAIAIEHVKAALENPIKHMKLPAIFQRNRANIIYKIQQQIAEALTAGESYGKMIKRLQKWVNFDRKKARLVARTEAGRAQSLGKEASIEKIKKYTNNLEEFWDASLDQVTRQSHRELDGQKTDEEGYFHYKGMKAKAPRLWGVADMDIQCRCTKRIQINGRQPSVRRARNYEDKKYQEKLVVYNDKLKAKQKQLEEAGKDPKEAKKILGPPPSPPTMVIPWMTYKEWYDNRIKKVS